MDTRRSLRGSAREAVLQFLKPHATLAVLTALAAAPFALVVCFVPHTLVLPTVSLAAIAVAGLAASLAWAIPTGQRRDTLTGWDIAGAFAFIGCAAGMLSEPENVLSVLGHSVVP